MNLFTTDIVKSMTFENLFSSMLYYIETDFHLNLLLKKSMTLELSKNNWAFFLPTLLLNIKNKMINSISIQIMKLINQLIA